MRTTAGIIAGFIAWLGGWVGSEKLLSAFWPDWFGLQQSAFQAAVADGASFTPSTRFLLTHVIAGAAVSMLAGSVAALIARGNRGAPLILGFLLLVLGVTKAAFSWEIVPVWYHFVFTGMLLPLAVVGGRLTGGRSAVGGAEGGT